MEGGRGKAIVHLRQGREWQVEAEFLHSVNGLAEGAGEVPAAHFSEGQSQESPGLSTEHNMDNQVWWGGQGVGDPAQAVAVALVAIPPTPVS